MNVSFNVIQQRWPLMPPEQGVGMEAHHVRIGSSGSLIACSTQVISELASDILATAPMCSYWVTSSTELVA